MTKEDYFSAAGKKRKALGHSATVLVLVDFINPMMFSGAETLLRPALEAAQATAKLKKSLSRRGCLSVYANDNYGIWRSDFKELCEACKALPGIRGDIATLLEPQDSDLIVLKPLHSAFNSTPLNFLLRQLKTQELVIVGLATDMCVHLTAMDAYMQGFKLWVPSNCTAAEEPQRKDATLSQMSRVLKCSIRQA